MKAKFTETKFDVLINYGYRYSTIEGGWISANRATIINENRSPYQRQIQQYNPNMQEAHEENITVLVDAGLAERGEQ